MAELQVVTAQDPRLLLEHAADCFLAPARGTLEEPFPTPPVLLALRQGGLRDDLIRLAAERGVKGWFDPPLCIFHELPQWLGGTDRKPCGEIERLVLLGRLFREQQGEVFCHLRRKEDYLDAVGRLFGELCAEEVTPEEFEQACGGRAERDAFEERRDAELTRAYRTYRGWLDQHGMRDGRDTLSDSARRLAEDPDALERRLGGRREIRFLGLNDLRGGWRTLLRALAASPALERVAIYTAAELELGDIPHAREVLPEPVTLAARLFDGAEKGSDPVRVVAAPDLEREAEEVACRVRALLDEGVAPHRIAVVSRQARPHVDRMVEALAAVGVPASARRRTGMEEIPVVRALLALFDAAAEGWTRAGLVEIAEHPYFDSALQPRVLDYIGYRERVAGLDAWEEQLSRLLARAEASERREGEEGEEERRHRPPASPLVRQALASFSGFREHAARLDGARPLREWVALLSRLLREDPWRFEQRIYALPAERVRLARPDLAGWKALRTLVREWERALAEWGGGEAPLDAAHFTLQLREMLRGDIPLWTEAHRGVLVQEGFAAVYRSFDHLFLVGMEAGGFPVRPPSSPLLDEAEREELIAAGLPLDPASAWERREAELFRGLVAGARESLTLSYAALDVSGREVIPSSFVEAVQDAAEASLTTIPASRVLTPRFPIFFDLESVDQIRRVAKIERVRQTGVLSPYSGLIEEPALLGWLEEEFGDERIWSPTQLESFAKCPWSYLATRLLRLESREDPSDDLDPLVRGHILHEVLERLYDAAAERDGGGPVLLREEDREWALAQVERELDAALATGGAREGLGHPALQEARRAELLRMLRKYLRFELDHNRKLFDNRSKNPRILRTGVVEHNLRFDDVALEVDGVVFRYRGIIDRVEQGIDERVPSAHFVAAVDYKTSKYSAPGAGAKEAWEDDVVLQVPLYAHALTQLRPERVVSRIEYRALKPGEVVHMLPLHTVDRDGKLAEDEEAHEKMEQALGAVARHVRDARSGRFPASPAPSCKCSPYCVAWDVCRVKGGPEKKGW